MTTETLPPTSPSDAAAVDELIAQALDARLGPADDGAVAQRQLVIINWSGQYDKLMPTLIMSSVAAASGYKAKVFLTFWGLLPFVKDEKRITGENWMQRMLTLMQRPGIDHLKLSQMNFMGMGPWMIGKLSKEYNVSSPRELLEACQAMGVEFLPCQMTMDMFGLKRDDFIDGLGEPVGAATVLELMTEERTASLFI